MKTPTIEDYQKRFQNLFGIIGGGLSILGKFEDEESFNGDLIPVNDWKSMVDSGGFIDYGGHGRFCFKRSDDIWVESNVCIHPSDITFLKLDIPEGFTHVLWFNR